jgi:hypothetical protein
LRVYSAVQAIDSACRARRYAIENRTRSVVASNPIYRGKNNIEPVSVLIGAGSRPWLQLERDDDAASDCLDLDIVKSVAAEVRL